MRHTSSLTTWLWLSLLCAIWLLGALLLLVASVPTAQSATPRSTNQLSTISFSRANYAINEGIGSGEIMLIIEPPSSTPVTVTLSSGSLDAEAGEDFEGVRDLLVIEPFENSYLLSIPIFDDDLVEGDEQLRLTLGNYLGVLPGTITETVVTIVDDDFVMLSIGDVTVSEAAPSVTLLVTQSVISKLDSVVNVRTVDGSATAPADYQSLFTTVTIPAGSKQASVVVPLNNDEVVEQSEAFFLQLENPINSDIATMTATVTLLDDDFFPKLTAQRAEANEIEGQMTFAVDLSAASPQTVTVEYATRDGTAVAPDDYLPVTGVLTIPPGATAASVVVSLVNDQVDEPAETFYLDLTGPVAATLNTTTVEGVIRDGFPNSLFLPGVAR